MNFALAEWDAEPEKVVHPVPKRILADLKGWGEIGIQPMHAHKTRGDIGFDLENLKDHPAAEGLGAIEGANMPTDSGEAVARYLADMTGQLETMARAAGQELLAYLLAMAHAEAEAITQEAHADPHSPLR